MRASFCWKAGEEEEEEEEEEGAVLWWWCTALVGGGGPASLVVLGDIVSIVSLFPYSHLVGFDFLILFSLGYAEWIDRFLVDRIGEVKVFM
jgi:hypothetical protein